MISTISFSPTHLSSLVTKIKKQKKQSLLALGAVSLSAFGILGYVYFSKGSPKPFKEDEKTPVIPPKDTVSLSSVHLATHEDLFIGNRGYRVYHSPKDVRVPEALFTMGEIIPDKVRDIPGKISHVGKIQKTFFDQYIKKNFFASSDGGKKGTDFGRNILEHLRLERQTALANIHSTCKQQNIAIIGQGVAGLITALEAYKSGIFRIIRVEGRKTCIRDQIVRLDTTVLEYFDKNFGALFQNLLFNRILTRDSTRVDVSIFASSSDEKSDFIAVELKDLEFLIDSILLALEKHYPEDGVFLSHIPCQLVSMAMKEEGRFTCQIEDSEGGSQTFEVDKVIAADGPKSKVRQEAHLKYTPRSEKDFSGVITFPNIFAGVDTDANYFTPEVYAQATGEEKDYSYISFPLRLAEQVLAQRKKGVKNSKEEQRLFHGYETPEDKERINGQLKIAEKGLESYRKELKEQWKWKKESLPINRFFYTDSTIYLGVDVPEEFFELMSKENNQPINERVYQRGYFSRVLTANFPKEMVNMLMPLMRTSFVFHSQLHQATLPSKDKELFLLGDAFANAQFQTGSGALKALYDAIDFGTYLQQSLTHPQKKETLRDSLETKLTRRAEEIQNKAFTLGIVKKISALG